MVADWRILALASCGQPNMEPTWQLHGRKRVNNNSPDYIQQRAPLLCFDTSMATPLSLSSLSLSPPCLLLLVSLVMMIRVILKRLIENALLRELAPNWKRISNDSILWLSPQSHYFANVMDQPSQLQPLLVRVNRSDPLGSLKAVHRIWHRRLDVRCVYV